MSSHRLVAERGLIGDRQTAARVATDRAIDAHRTRGRCA
jgi:hypothetical protein